MENHNEEPIIEPELNRWYNITLGPSLLSNNHSYSPRFCTLRYEFKPASIDNTKPGMFHKSKDNKVTLEFQNNQLNKPKVSFNGVSEDYNDKDKDKDAILFFDGESFRLEKLHRAVKRLKYLRVPEESFAASRVITKVKKMVQIDINNPVSLEHEVEEFRSLACEPVKTAQIDINNPVSLEHELEEDVNIDDDDNDNDGQEPAREEKKIRTGGLDIDINLPHPTEMEDDEIAVVDINDDESYKGLNAAEALRAQVNAEARDESTKSSSESSESRVESSGSGSSSESSSEGGTASESGSRASH